MSCRGISTIGRSGVAALVALAFAVLALPALASAADGGISGEVTRALGSTPVPDAKVCAEGRDGTVFRCALTAADGTYEISDLAPGTYVVRFDASEAGLFPEYWESAGREYATDVVVTSGETTTGIRAALNEHGSISGRVTAAANGAPLREVLVCAWSEADGEPGSCNYTANDGTYEIGAHGGFNRVEFMYFGPEYEDEFLNSVQVRNGYETSNASVGLFKPGRIGGHVYSAATHQPLSEIAVCAIDGNGRARQCDRTGKFGAYEFDDVLRGPWRIAFSPESGDFPYFESSELNGDGWPTQYWNLQPTLAQGDAITMGQGRVVGGIDGLLGYVPPLPAGGLGQPSSVNPEPAPVPVPVPTSVAANPAPLSCPKGKVKKRVKGKLRCVKRQKPRQHRKHHHR